MTCVCAGHGCRYCRDFNERQGERYGWAEVTFCEIQLLPVTNDCPDCERL